MKDKILNRGNWFMVEIIERCEPVGADSKNDLRRCTVCGNFHLIKAANADKAFDKAVKLGKSGNYKFKNVNKINMEWKFLGIGDILPIYENIEDKAEILWTDYGFISARRSKRFVKSKNELIANLKLGPK